MDTHTHIQHNATFKSIAILDAQNYGLKSHFLRVMFHRGGGWGTARAVLRMVDDESHQHLGVAASLSAQVEGRNCTWEAKGEHQF